MQNKGRICAGPEKRTVEEGFAKFKFLGFSLVEMLMTRVSRCVRWLMKPTQSTTALGFSLVEMLMALLVASILMVAMAPAVTRKFNETITVNGGVAGSIVTKPKHYKLFTSNGTFTVPADTSRIKVAISGGGGGGGSASFVGQAFTSNGSMTVPANITEIRYFIIGGGGGGASGGKGHKEPTFTTSGTTTNFTTQGETSYSVPSTAKLPAFSGTWADCNTYTDKKWLLSTDTNVKYDPNTYILNVTACGGGGGSGGSYGNVGGGGGGSGGYVENMLLTTTASTLYVKIPGGGGGGGSGYNSTSGLEGGTYAGKGGNYNGASDGTSGSGTQTSKGGQGAKGANSYIDQNAGNGGNGSVYYGGSGGNSYQRTWICGPGGGGGPTTITTSSGTGGTIVFQVGGGGGGGGGGAHSGGTAGPGGAGGGGGGGYGGGGGGAGGCTCDVSDLTNCNVGQYIANSLGSGGSGYSSGTLSISAGNPGGNGSKQYGGRGGAGVNGVGGGTSNSGGQISSTTFNQVFPKETYCSGGTSKLNATGSNGLPGAMQISYGKTFKCIAKPPMKGGGGGGAGQVIIGRYASLPASGAKTISVTIGSGGAGQATNPATAGTAGGATIIKYSSTTIATANGGYAGGFSAGGTARNVTVSDNWQTGVASYGGGAKGNDGGNVSGNTGGSGGNGGVSANTNRAGGTVAGGNGGAAGTAGSAATNYGAGGGGGGGSSLNSDTWGAGGAGKSGYAYIEYGGGNGGGGTMGEYIIATFDSTHGITSNLAIPLTVGNGGAAGANGSNSTFGTSGKAYFLTAKGGFAGNPGTNRNVNGDEKVLTKITYANANTLSAKGQAGEINYEAKSGRGGNGGYMEDIFTTIDGNKKQYVTVGLTTLGPIQGGCGGYNTISCTNGGGYVGGAGTFGGGGGGGAINFATTPYTAGAGGAGGKGFVIVEYETDTE